jgi:23S rRNA (uridine2479-2'-O)-methyltransferase
MPGNKARLTTTAAGRTPRRDHVRDAVADQLPSVTRRSTLMSRGTWPLNRSGSRDQYSHPVGTGDRAGGMPAMSQRQATEARVAATLRVTTRNARFQQWEALLANRTKRQRAGEFVVQGVRPITMAIQAGWQIHELLYDADARLSAWARETLDRFPATTFAVANELMFDLGAKADTAPELLAVVGMPPDDLDRIPSDPGMLTVVFDRPTSPGNVGTLIRSADAFGASGVIVTGHAADVYDPKSVRASTGSLFSVPVVRVASHRTVIDWAAARRAAGTPVALVGTDEHGELSVAEYDFTQPTLVLVGNETNGLSSAWRDACDHLVRIPIVGMASSLNASTAASIVLYESARQRAARKRA